MKSILIGLAVCAISLPGIAHADNKAQIVSRGHRFEIKNVLREEGTTVVLFLQDTSAMEQQFLADLEKQLPDDARVGLEVVRLKDITAPAAQQYAILVTPTAIVYDRFGRELARTSQPDQIRAAVRKGQLMARIKWIDEDDPKAPEVYGAPPEVLKRGLPGIVKTMALRPEAYQMFKIMSEIHFTDGFLKRREHEMIAAYVSSLNKCKFWVGSHASALQKQGVSQDIVDAIGTGDLSKVALTPKDAALLTYVKLLTLNSANTKDADVQTMRDAGWTDEQIWEATLEVGIFSLLNRMADAHGLDYPTTGWYPPQLRAKLEREKQAQSGSQ